MVLGQGSGFVWDKAGHVVTNYHVVKGAAEVKVGKGVGWGEGGERGGRDILEL